MAANVTLYYNGKVYTGELPLCQAFIVRDGKFLACGTDEEMKAAFIEAAGPCGQEYCKEQVDLQGHFVSAGFHDSHMHLLNFGRSLSTAPLHLHTESLADLLACLRDFLAAHPVREGQWLLGRGWNQDYFRDVSRMPDRHDLDRISTEIPIMITRTCGHCCVVNTKALELAGVGPETEAPEGGSIGYESAGGEGFSRVLNGRFFDNAMNLVSRALPQPTKEELKEMIRLAAAELNRYGITSVGTDDYCVFRSIAPETVNEAYREMEKEGLLTVRVNEQCNLTGIEALKSFLGGGNLTGSGTPLFRIGPLKMLGDGALGSRTAHLTKPYLDDSENSGFSLFTQEEFDEMISWANAHGMQVAVHAIGDACLDRVLNAVEKALQEHPREDHRHGIVHCQISREDQLRRMERLGLHIYAQSVFLDYDNHIVEKLVAPELAAFSYHWKTLLDHGLTVSNGSDCPVELPDVMKGIECAVTRKSLDGTGPFHEEEAYTVQEALDSFTRMGAWSSFEETIKGQIRAGYLADFTVLDRDPFETAPGELHTIQVTAAYLSGSCVFSA